MAGFIAQQDEGEKRPHHLLQIFGCAREVREGDVRRRKREKHKANSENLAKRKRSARETEKSLVGGYFV